MKRIPLAIVMPVYNEEEAVRKVVEDWVGEIRKVVGTGQFVFIALNDGSKDKTADVLKVCASQFQEMHLIDKPNSGHGQSCILGYEKASSMGAEWVFQIDSDGQCDPKFFSSLWSSRHLSNGVFGFRQSRDDGFQRWVISRIVSVFSWVATGVWVRDANVPYRLMKSDTLKDVLPFVPKDFHLANILVSLLFENITPIFWVNIHFRDRTGGSPSVKAYSFFKHGIKLFVQLRQAYRQHLNFFRRSVVPN